MEQIRRFFFYDQNLKLKNVLKSRDKEISTNKNVITVINVIRRIYFYFL